MCSAKTHVVTACFNKADSLAFWEECVVAMSVVTSTKESEEDVCIKETQVLINCFEKNKEANSIS